jgi:hypothetical protein
MGTADNNMSWREVRSSSTVFNSWLHWERKWICGKIFKNVPVTCYNFDGGADAYRQPTVPQNKSLSNIMASQRAVRYNPTENRSLPGSKNTVTCPGFRE